MSDLQAKLDELEARLAALEPKPREVTPNWGERTCQVCGALADVIDLERPAEYPVQAWNGEGYCREHGDAEGVTADDHPHLLRPGPPRKKS